MRTSVEDREQNKDDAGLQLEFTTQRVGVADDMNALFQQMETKEKQSSTRRLDISSVLSS